MKHLAWGMIFGLVLWISTPLTAWGFQKGEVVPDIQARNIDGNVFRLYEQQGDAFLLNLGASWCPGCVGQSKQINKIHEFLNGNNITYVEVFHQDSEAAIRKALAASSPKLNPQAILDDGKVRKSYNVFAIPRLLILNRNFQVVYDGGPLAAREIIKYLETAKGEMPGT